MNNTLIVNLIMLTQFPLVKPRTWSEQHKRTPAFTNGFVVTTGINISRIKYPKIIVNLCFNQFSVHWTIKTRFTFVYRQSCDPSTPRPIENNAFKRPFAFTCHCRWGRCSAIDIANMNAIAAARVSVPSHTFLWWQALGLDSHALSHMPHYFEEVRIVFVNCPRAIQVVLRGRLWDWIPMFITHAPLFEGVRIMFVNRPRAIQVW